MGQIKVIIVDDHTIVSDGIKALFDGNYVIEVVDVVPDISQLLVKLRSTIAHIILLNIYSEDDFDFKKINTIHNKYPKINILILSMFLKDDFVLKSLRAGAKGYLTKHTNRKELLEAIYSLRSGHDYYTKSISDIVLKDYLKKMNTKNTFNKKTGTLSEREIEVLKLYSEGYTNNEIANKLFISIRTVESHKNHIMKKLNVRTTVDLVKFAIKNNIIEI